MTTIDWGARDTEPAPVQRTHLPKRIALAAVPVLSLGMLAWLPLVYLRATTPRHLTRRRRDLAIGAFWLAVATVTQVVSLTVHPESDALTLMGGAYMVAFWGFAAMLVWLHTRPYFVTPPGAVASYTFPQGGTYTISTDGITGPLNGRSPTAH